MKIVTFNVRCSWDKDGINSFPHRAGGIVRKINEERPDVIGFQECTDPITNLLRKALPDYVILFNQRRADLRGEGLATAIRKDTTEILGLESFWLSPTPFLPGSRYEEQSACPRICQSTLLRTGDFVFRLYNIHLDHISEHARTLGMQATLKKIAEDRERADLPLFLLGDFNATPDEETLRLCETKLTQLTDGIDSTFHDFGKRTAPCKIDYIFSDAETAGRCANAVLWTDESDGIYLSDHYPVCVRIEL